MLVQILEDIFTSDVYYPDIDNIFKHFRTGKHTLILKDFGAIEALKASEWYKENPRDQKIIDSYIKASTKKSSRRLSITISVNDTKINFMPQEADKYLDQPLVVLLENSEYDPPFLNAVMKHFDSDGVLITAKKEQWLRYGMGGGSSAGSVIKGEIKNSFTHECFTKGKNIYLRYFVILDSDRRYPEMVIPENKTQTFKDNNVSYHILYKREKENYIPLNVIRSLRDTYLDLYTRFPKHDQRDFFDLEYGFRIARNRASEEIQKMYPEDDVPAKNWEILRRGITMEKYSGVKFKTEFSKLFDDKDVTKATMFEIIRHQPLKDNMNEYELIIEGIKSLL